MDALYSGVKMQTINGEKTIHGAMVSLCGDTLAQHELAGFKEGVGFCLQKGQTYVQVKYYLGDVMELHNSSNDS
ncbi:hypothetical protein KUCAC02_033652 [Chaenocephalus aceratus]|nr:hypothetical protein KUCAC02_033652 [Chaenocephalus aceratus]